MEPLVTLLLGHRGAGKTTFLRGLATFARARGVDFQALDLDEEVEKASGLSIAELFKRGEDAFRRQEVSVLEGLVRGAVRPTAIAVGAGFSGPLPRGVRTLWLRRETDVAGRSFLNRPRLHEELSPLAEYKARFQLRDQRFAEWADEELAVPEGYNGGLEGFYFTSAPRTAWDVTLLPENFRDLERFLGKRQTWQIRLFELRDDLLSREQVEHALARIPRDKILYSRRLPQDRHDEVGAVRRDWALELGAPPVGYDIVSLHEREEDFDATLARLERGDAILKLAVEVKDFTELKRGHEWWLRDPERRVFLPRSQNGRWRWYRSLFGPRMPVHFFREGSGSSLDQPLLWQCWLQPPLQQSFAALLGQPVAHSRSPMEHLQFFKDKQIPFVSIELPEEEFAFAVQFLQQLGLSFAAVTAPLKKLAWAHSTSLSPEARRTQAVNTLLLHGGHLSGHNTDVLALADVQRDLMRYQTVWLWGGGGIKSSVKTVWPQVQEISARQGLAPPDTPDLVIWATGRGRPFTWPPARVRPQLILDLNYGEDSPGLEWAAREGLAYESGLKMFKAQAEYQRGFWDNRL